MSKPVYKFGTPRLNRSRFICMNSIIFCEGVNKVVWWTLLKDQMVFILIRDMTFNGRVDLAYQRGL